MKTPTQPRDQEDHPASLYDYDEDFWRKRFASEPGTRQEDTYEDFEPAYRYGVQLRAEYQDFDPNEATIRERWDKEKGSSRLSWDRARGPVKIAWFQDREFAEAKPEEMLAFGKNS